MASFPPVGDNISTLVCSTNPYRNSCQLTQAEMGERDSIATVRIIASCLGPVRCKVTEEYFRTQHFTALGLCLEILYHPEIPSLPYSLLGASSIIVTAIRRKQVFSPKVHPIFVLSLADCMLAVLWVVGGNLWLRRTPSMSRVGCYSTSLLTIVLQCVTINLTLVYALLAYSRIKRQDFANILLNSTEDQVWHPLKTAIAYLIALVLPMVIVMIQFGGVWGLYSIVDNANACSCWCYPVFGNVLPYAVPRDQPTAEYIYHLNMVIASYGFVVGTNYLVVFVLLVIVYYKILKRIKGMRVKLEADYNTSNYGATQTLIVQGQSKAKKRVFLFLSVFIVNGFFNFILSYFFMFYEAFKIREGPSLYDGITEINKRLSPGYKMYLIAFILQSLTTPLQGFLNAIVYGWTRDDFLYAMAITANDDDEASSDDGLDVEESVIKPDTTRPDATLTSSGSAILTSGVKFRCNTDMS